MRRRFGGLLVMALGAVLVGTGLSTSSITTVGGTVSTTSSTSSTAAPTPTATPCQTFQVGSTPVCPENTITINEGTAGTASPHALSARAVPASWTVTISSDCALPGGTSPTVTVPTNGSAVSGNLFIYATSDSTTKCHYTLTETPVAGYTAAFAPPSPEVLSTGASLVVHLANDTAATTSSAVPTPRPTVSASTGATTATLPFTGPHHDLRASVVIGIVLLLGGGVLTAGAGRPRRRAGQHRV